LASSMSWGCVLGVLLVMAVFIAVGITIALFG
jgi:hypothetical protein